MEGSEDLKFARLVAEYLGTNHHEIVVTEEEMISASQAVGCHELIMKLPQNYNTMLEERGSNLSLGERQLISFARALVADPKILILDEATNSLDKKSEDFVIEEIKKLKGKKTIILISHNHNTLKNCDKIYKIQNQKIVDVTNAIQI